MVEERLAASGVLEVVHISTIMAGSILSFTLERLA